jgi:hypothetical protein
MATVAARPSTSIKEPFHSRESHLFGVISLYAPNDAPNTWGDNPWILQTEKGPDGPLKYSIRPEYLMQAFERPHFVPLNPSWQTAGVTLS